MFKVLLEPYLVLNGSPKTNGTVAQILKAVADGASNNHEIEWVDVYRLRMKPCTACMKCRPDGECCLPEDDAHAVGRKIREADALVVGTPTHWGNMSAQLKLLFDRNVPAFMGEKPNGMPIPRHKGKPAVVATACSTPWPFNFIAAESRGALRAVQEVLHYGGFRVRARLVAPGTKARPGVPAALAEKARRVGRSL